MPVAELVEQARRLGLLDTIHVGPPQSLDAVQQHLLYAIVIDFEATCWPQKSIRHPEIIEFPAVLVNLRTGRILSEYHQYVRPTEAPQLSAFCIELTGITQAQVDGSQPLPAVLDGFVAWLKRNSSAEEANEEDRPALVLPKTNIVNRTGNACFVTWSDWDLGVCLRMECERKRLQAQRPGCLDQWMDLRAVYRTWYANSAKNFGDALRRVGMRFEGRPHSGIADARNTARLACRMWRDGCPLRVTKDLKPFIVFNRPL